MPAGGTITYTYQSLGTPSGPSDTTTATRQTTVTDRDGNDDDLPVQPVQQRPRASTRSTTATSDRATRRHYLTTYSYDTNYRLTQETLPAGNTLHLHLRQLATPAGSSRATCCP